MYKDGNLEEHHLKAYADYLAKDQALPQNDSADGNGVELRASGTKGGIEIVVKVRDQITLTDTKIMSAKLQHKNDGGSYTDLHILFSVTASGSTVKASGTILARFILPEDCKDFIKAVLTTDDAAVVGSLDIYPRYLPR